MNDLTCIVIRHADYREQDRMLTLFSLEQGKISALARGAKKPTGKLRAASELMFCGTYSFSETKGYLYVSQAVAKISFFNIASDYDAYLSAMLMLFCTDLFSMEMPDSQLFALLTNCLAALNGGADHRSASAFFLAKLLDISGYGIPHELLPKYAAADMAAMRALTSRRCSEFTLTGGKKLLAYLLKQVQEAAEVRIGCGEFLLR